MMRTILLAFCITLIVGRNTCGGTSSPLSCLVSPLRTAHRRESILSYQRLGRTHPRWPLVSRRKRNVQGRQVIPLSAPAPSTADAAESQFTPDFDSVEALNTNKSYSAVRHTTSSATPAEFDWKPSPGILSLSMVMMPLLVLCVMTFGDWWRYYMAGGICASLSHALTTPIDVIKTRQQIDFYEPQGKKGFMKTAYSIVRKEGVQTLLAGLGPTTVGYLLEGAAKFGTYEMLKPYVKSALTFLAVYAPFIVETRMAVYVISAAISGLAASAILCPMESLRIRLVAEPEFAGQKGWIYGFVTMLRQEGLGANSGLLKGMTAVTAKQVPYTITKQVSFDIIATMLYQRVRAVYGSAALEGSTRMKLLIPLFAAFSASVLSCIASQPGDMLLSVVSAHEGKKRTRDFAKEILHKDGWKGFFVGMQARFLHVGAIVTVQLLIYDVVKRLCGIPATGS